MIEEKTDKEKVTKLLDSPFLREALQELLREYWRKNSKTYYWKNREKILAKARQKYRKGKEKKE